MAQILILLLLRFWLLTVGLQLALLLFIHFPPSTHAQQQFQPSHRQQKWINAQIYQPELIIAQQPQRRSALEPSNRQLLQPRQISDLAHGLPPQYRAKIRNYKTNKRSERQTTIVIDCSAPHNGQCDAGTDFNPALAGGIQGAPGIKARLNPRAFQYLSTIFGGILNYMIKRARLPTISQCLPAPISGCINVYNLYVSRYRCPQRVTVYPNPPNQIVVDVQNLDVGVTGNLGGQINILIPIALFGIVQVNAHQVSVRVAVTIVNGPDGGPRIQMVSCAASVGYVDVYIQNGGLIGDIANSQLRGKISEMVRQQIPGQLCQRLPGILDSEINSKISGIIPRFIPVSKLLEIAINAFGLGNLLGGTGQCPASCNFRKAAALGTAQKKNSSVLVLPPHLHLEQKMKLSNFNGSENKNGEILTRPTPERLLLKEQYEPNLAKGPPMHMATNAGLNSGNNGGGGKTLNHARLLAGQKSGQGLPVIINSGTTGVHQNRTTHLHRRQLIAPLAPHAARPSRAAGSKIFALTRPRNDRATPSESGRVAFVDPGENLCQNCPNTGGQDNPLSFLAVILQSMDLSKLNNVYLNVQVMNTYATDHDFTIELNGEFSVCGRGCTPFGAFPMQFPNCVGCKMIEVLISDFTINSLLYHLHNIGFLRVRIGPETPKIGDLLKTTCGENEGDEGLEDHGVETEEGILAQKKRRRRQDAAGDLASLGICLGDILPAVREKYPNERVYIIISTERAPSVLLSQRNGGTAFVDIVVNADFYIQLTNQKVGTIRIAANIDVTVKPQPNRITAHAEITSLNLQDVGNQLGLPQDALDNLGNLGKEIILKAGNDALERGSSLNIPNGIAGLPISIIDPEIHFLEHALLIQADFTLNPAALGGSEPC